MTETKPEEIVEESAANEGVMSEVNNEAIVDETKQEFSPSSLNGEPENEQNEKVVIGGDLNAQEDGVGDDNSPPQENIVDKGDLPPKEDVVNEVNLPQNEGIEDEHLLKVHTNEGVVSATPAPSREDIMENDEDPNEDVVIESFPNGQDAFDDAHIDAVSVSAVSDDSGIQDTILLDEDAFTHQRIAWCAKEKKKEKEKEKEKEREIYLEHQGHHRGQLLGRGHQPRGQNGSPRKHEQHRGKQRLGSESKEAIYRHALTLMSERCTTSHSLQRLGRQQIRDLHRTPIASLKKPPFGPSTPQYFYIHQKKPSPMQPLRAWKGYHGNIYFEPIGIKKADATPPPSATRQAIDNLSDKDNTSRDPHHLPSTAGRRPPPRPATRAAPPGPQGSRSAQRPKQIVHLDKRAVLDSSNATLQEDLLCVVGLESPGSLCVMSPEHDARTAGVASSSASASRERIHKGSVAHKVFTMKNRNFPLLSVSGDKFNSPQKPSPLLQTQTTYSLSNQRMNMNSPDIMYAGASYEKLPPLEQLRASLKHMSTASQPLDFIQGQLSTTQPPPPHVRYGTAQSTRHRGHRVQ